MRASLNDVDAAEVDGDAVGRLDVGRISRRLCGEPMGRGSMHRKQDGERRTGALDAPHLDVAPVAGDDVLDDGQAESRTAGRA